MRKSRGTEKASVFPVDNYLVFYLPDEAEHTVYIVRIMYSGRDVPVTVQTPPKKYDEILEAYHRSVSG